MLSKTTITAQALLDMIRFVLKMSGIGPLPLWAESVFFGFGGSLLIAGWTYWQTSGQEGFTWQGLVLVLLGVAINYASSLLRLLQESPVGKPATIEIEDDGTNKAEAERDLPPRVEIY